MYLLPFPDRPSSAQAVRTPIHFYFRLYDDLVSKELASYIFDSTRLEVIFPLPTLPNHSRPGTSRAGCSGEYRSRNRRDSQPPSLSLPNVFVRLPAWLGVIDLACSVV